MESYKEMLLLLERSPFESPLLRELQEKVRKNGGASRALAALERIGAAVEARHNGLAFFLYNSLLSWDLHCMNRLADWTAAYGREAEIWLLTVGETEALISLAVPAMIGRTAVFPAVEEGDRPFLLCRGMRHPLMEGEPGGEQRFSVG